MRDAAIERPGFLEARNDVLSIMYLNDITSVVNRQINGVARYAGLAIPLHNWHAVMNQKLYADEGGKWRIQSTVRETLDQQTKLEREGGQDLIDGFIEAVKEIPKREYQDLPAKLGAKLTANYVKAVLLMNIRVALTQAASYPTAAAVVPWRYLGAFESREH